MRLSECAADLSVSTDFLQREIARGRLCSRRHVSVGGRVSHSVDRAEWNRYLATYWPQADDKAPHLPDESSTH